MKSFPYISAILGAGALLSGALCITAVALNFYLETQHDDGLHLSPWIFGFTCCSLAISWRRINRRQSLSNASYAFVLAGVTSSFLVFAQLQQGMVAYYAYTILVRPDENAPDYRVQARLRAERASNPLIRWIVFGPLAMAIGAHWAMTRVIHYRTAGPPV